MQHTLDTLQQGEQATIVDISSEYIPLKLVEMGCLPGNTVTLLQTAPFLDPIYLNINDSFVAIRKETAQHILIEKHHE